MAWMLLPGNTFCVSQLPRVPTSEQKESSLVLLAEVGPRNLNCGIDAVHIPY